MPNLLTPEDVVDLNNQVQSLSKALEELFGVLYDNTELSDEFKAEIYKVYQKHF